MAKRLLKRGLNAPVAVKRQFFIFHKNLSGFAYEPDEFIGYGSPACASRGGE